MQRFPLVMPEREVRRVSRTDDADRFCLQVMLKLRTALVPLPGWASMRITPSARGKPARASPHLISLPGCWQNATPFSATAW